MENECEALPGVAYPGVRDNRSTVNTKTGYDDDDNRQIFNYNMARIASRGKTTIRYTVSICAVVSLLSVSSSKEGERYEHQHILQCIAQYHCDVWPSRILMHFQ